MSNIVVVAEKPSVAKDISEVLGARKKEDGFYSGNNYIVTWCLGHLVGLAYPGEYDPALNKWKFEDLPIIPDEMKLVINSKTKQQFNIVKKLLNEPGTKEVICATDSGREGQLIFEYVYHKSNCKKPVKRLWISSLTEESIKDGFKNLKDNKDYYNLYLSAKCRAEADWIIGLNSTRAFSVKNNEKLSIGRVQTPVVAMIVNKDKEIKSFKQQTYFEVQGQFENYLGLWSFDNESKINDEDKANELVEKVSEKPGEIIDVINENKNILPPLLYDLTTIQREAVKYFGLTAKKTLDIVQKLYETHKIVTYPRTDSSYLSEDMVSTLPGILNNLLDGPYKSYVNKVLENQLNITKRIVDNSKVTDHHAIIPTNKKAKLELTKDEANIYDLIVKRFISVFLPKHEYMSTKIITVVEGEQFISKGKTITQAGWQELYSFKKDENEKEQVLPILNKGDKVRLIKAKKLAKKTTPPKHFNEDSLLGSMENIERFVEDDEIKESLKAKGIGTPATRASIIEKIIDVGYVKREKKNLIATEKGINLIEIVSDNVKSPEMTGEWELMLNKIAEGKGEHKLFMKGIHDLTKEIVREAASTETICDFNKKEKKEEEKEVLGKCLECEYPVYETLKAYSCSNNNCKFAIWKEDKWFLKFKKKINKTMAKNLLKKQRVTVKGLYSEKKNKAFDADVIISKNGSYWSYSLDFKAQK